MSSVRCIHIYTCAPERLQVVAELHVELSTGERAIVFAELAGGPLRASARVLPSPLLLRCIVLQANKLDLLTAVMGGWHGERLQNGVVFHLHDAAIMIIISGAVLQVTLL